MLQYISGHGSNVAYTEMEFLLTKKGGRSLIFEGHRYVVNRRGRDGRIFWRCGRSRTCRGTVTTLEDDVISQRNKHNHPPDEAEQEAAKIVAKMRKAAETTVHPIPAIYQEELQQIATHPRRDEIAAAMPPLEQIKSSLYAHRRMRLPPLPSSRANICLEGEWTKTASGDDFLIADDGDDDKVLIFATDDNIRQLCRADTVYGDGTFQTCPRLFYEIFTLHIFCHGKQHPVLYALLPNKRRDTYQRMLTLVKQKATSLGTVLDPPAFLADFELAIKQAVQLAFPTAEYQGCYFHFCQSLMRRVQRLGLQVQYQDDSELRSFIKKVAALAFVPPRFVRVAW